MSCHAIMSWFCMFMKLGGLTPPGTLRARRSMFCQTFESEIISAGHILTSHPLPSKIRAANSKALKFAGPAVT